MKRVLAIFLVAAMLFGLIPGNAVAFAEDNTMFTESQFGTDFGTLGNRDISKEKWTVKLSDGTVIPNAKVSSKKNAFIPGQFDYTVVFSQAELDKLAAPGKKIKILDKGHSIEVTKGKNAPLMKFSNGELEKKNGEYSVLLNLLLGPTAKIEEGVIVVNSEVVEKIAVAWKLETVDGKSLDGTVKLDGDYYVVQVKTDSLKKSVEEDRTFLGINTSGGGVYSIDGTGNNSKKVCDYTYHKVDKDFLEYKFEAQLVSSVNEGKIVFDLIAPNTKSSPKWEIKTKNGLTVPVTRQDFLNFIESPHDLYLPNNPFQNWVFGVYIKKDVLVEELKKQGYEFLGFDPEDTDNTVLNMSGIEYSLDGSAKKLEVTADLKNNRRYFFDISEDTDTAEYYCKIILNEKDKLIDLQSAVLYLDIRTKSLNKVIVDPNGGKVRYADLNTSEVTIHDKPFELKFNKDEEFYGPVNAFKKGERFLGWFYKDGDQIEFPFKVNGLYNIEARYEEIDYERNFKVNVIAKVEGDDKTYNILFPRSSRTSSTWTDNENLMKDSFITRISEGAISVALRDVLEDRQEFEITGYKVNLTGAYNYDKNQAVVVDASHQTFKKNGEDFEYEYTGQYEKSDGQIEGGTIVLNIKPGKKFYEVTFDVGDALFNGEKTQIVEKGSFVKNPTVLPFKKGFVFKGWYTNEDKPFEFDKMAINADTRIVAKFASLMGAENKYGFRVYAKFEGIDGLFPLQGYTIERKLEPQGEYSNTVITARIERTKLSEQIEKLGFVLTDDLKSDIDLRGFQNYIDYEENDIFDDPDEVVEDDFIFDTKEATVTYSFFHKEETGQVEGGIILFVLQPNHRVKLELDGGRTPTASTFNVAKGSIIGEKLVPPTKRKYTFTGWMSGGKPFDPTKDVVTGNITLVAQYEPLKRYNGQGIKILFRHEGKIIDVDKQGTGGIVSMTAGKEGGEYIVKLQAVISSKLVNKIVEPEQSYVRVLGGTVQSLKGHYTSKGSKENEKYMVSPDSDEFSPDHYQLLVEDYNVNDINGNPEIGKLFIIRIPLVEDYGQVESGVLIIELELESNKKHKVTFNPNGGVYFGLTEVMIPDGGTVNVPADEPVKTGHKFLYWALEGETAAYNFDKPITQDITLVAVYESLNPAPINKFIVTFDPNGGMLNGSTKTFDVEVEENQLVSQPTNPTKDGHKFIEWRKDGAAYNFDSFVTESFKLVAYYEKENTGGNDGGNTGGNTGGNDNTGGNTGGNDNTGGNTGTGNNQGTTDSGVDFFPDTTTGSTGGTTGTVEIEEEGTPLSNVEKTDDVLMNGEKTSLKIGKDGTIVVTEADLKDVKDPILMSFKLENGDHTHVTFQKEGEKNIVIPISVYLDGRMHVVIAGPGTYVAKEAPTSFRGVPEKHWGIRFIQIVGARQLMVGNEHGDFMPDVPTTRAMFTQILARLQKVDLTSVQSNHYADVPMDKWYAASVNWATDQGIVNGVGGGKFAPEDAITREQMAVMIYHYLKLNNWKLAMKAGATQFADYDLVSGWAKDAVTELKDYGIFEGKPGHKFDPKANATRAEVATVVARLLELYIKSLQMK